MFSRALLYWKWYHFASSGMELWNSIKNRVVDVDFGGMKRLLQILYT